MTLVDTAARRNSGQEGEIREIREIVDAAKATPYFLSKGAGSSPTASGWAEPWIATGTVPPDRNIVTQTIYRMLEARASEEEAAQASNLEALRGQLEEIGRLGKDWDGHGAAVISPDAVQYAMRFAAALPSRFQHLEPFPEPDGSVGLEYHRGREASIYLSFSHEGHLAYVVVFRDRGIGEEEVHRGRGIKLEKDVPERIMQLLNAKH